MLKKDLRDILAGIFVCIVGLFFALVGSDYAFGHASRMGPGYMPVILGWLLFGLGLLILIPAFFRPGETLVIHWDSLCASLAALVVFALCLNRLGVFLSTIVAVLIASLPKRMNLGVRGTLAIAIAVITSVIFVAGLNMTVTLFPEF